ncbi:MAG: hypothetical protein GY792_26435 [Gammaproteobacteria bacterium]|nr:hypothetical protein [Gammaproteobacteria bacterium]
MENHPVLESAVDTCADRLNYLNEAFPLLATQTTLEGVVLWRQRQPRKRPHEFENESQSREKTDIDIRLVAINLLKQNSLEDVLDLLAENHHTELSLPELIRLIDGQEYMIALKRELNELLKNAISFEQISALWNDLGRPAFGGPSWNSRNISTLTD